MMPQVHNKHYHTGSGIYIGRPQGDIKEHFGNPFTHLKKTKAAVRTTTREESITAFTEWLDGTKWQEIEPERRQWILDNVHLLQGQDLICWCKPSSCHGDDLLLRANKENPDEEHTS